MDGIPGSTLTGPFPVGQYAAALRERLRGFTRVQVFGEGFGFKAGRAKVWFELRDAAGALPCSMWRGGVVRRAAVLDGRGGLRPPRHRPGPGRGPPRGRRGRLRLLPRLAHLVAVVLVR